jgi:hypothetical protein
MRKFPNVSAFPALLSLFFGFVFIAPVAAQAKKNKVEEKPAHYEYYAGVKIASALGANCSMISGTIREVKNSKIIFSVKEKILGNKPETDVIELNYRNPPVDFDYRKKAFRDALLIDKADARAGAELLFFLCEERTPVRYAYAETDAKLFPSIKKAVEHFISYQKDPEVILKIPELARAENDELFIGYLIESASGLMSLTHSDYAVIALSRLLENDKIPDYDLYNLNYQLWALISGSEVFPITDETRDTALRRIVGVGSSNRKLAKQAVSILARIAERDTVDLKPYLNAQNKPPLLENLKSLPAGNLPQKDKGKFEKLLLSN